MTNPDLVMAEKDGRIYRTHPAQAARDGATVLDESTVRPDGRLKEPRRSNGRPLKPKTSVAREAAKNEAARAAQTAEEASE